MRRCLYLAQGGQQVFASMLTFRGLPCPNIATGGYNAHSVREFVPVPSLEVTVDLLEKLVARSGRYIRR